MRDFGRRGTRGALVTVHLKVEAWQRTFKLQASVHLKVRFARLLAARKRGRLFFEKDDGAVFVDFAIASFGSPPSPPSFFFFTARACTWAPRSLPFFCCRRASGTWRRSSGTSCVAPARQKKTKRLRFQPPFLQPCPLFLVIRSSRFKNEAKTEQNVIFLTPYTKKNYHTRKKSAVTRRDRATCT